MIFKFSYLWKYVFKISLIKALIDNFLVFRVYRTLKLSVNLTSLINVIDKRVQKKPSSWFYSFFLPNLVRNYDLYIFHRSLQWSSFTCEKTLESKLLNSSVPSKTCLVARIKSCNIYDTFPTTSFFVLQLFTDFWNKESCGSFSWVIFVWFVFCALHGITKSREMKMVQLFWKARLVEVHSCQSFVNFLMSHLLDLVGRKNKAVLCLIFFLIDYLNTIYFFIEWLDSPFFDQRLVANFWKSISRPFRNWVALID